MQRIAFSPCPNDTFIFHALVKGLIKGAPPLDVTYADIDKTNYWAQDREGPGIMKISYAALPYVVDDYQLIPCGGALGRGVGPLVLTKEPADGISFLKGKTVAVPSDRSTAYMLFRLWVAQRLPEGVGKIVILPFQDIMPAVRDGKVDAGLVIHEARFTYPLYGLNLLQDLGDWWEQDTGAPIPLGAIIARKGQVDAGQWTDWIRSSVQYAFDHPDASAAYVMEHAQEMEKDVQKQHIDLYVNEFSLDLGKDGFHAVDSLLGRAAKEGLVPEIDLKRLRLGE
ncbi:1,4-dihydroxy-6-naphthoate synthase [Salisediminibacterium selenitireducens]|uniref:1,4-dihydroxy-6-naphtoate synthase n=1 Tax=Bacillus selenitireducens (strain ATCC 700615 / DSM 15326 / MLS10) TaxID=439292 RepID=D6XXG0_BACIE|nr:1,4-dihydroxy-6-naphthoate synthase [Salisediminibacterium selenitireducens]ADH98017.1 protein of unknown function DUF191 [[Bacillus] selenitireducens MLS10]